MKHSKLGLLSFYTTLIVILPIILFALSVLFISNPVILKITQKAVSIMILFPIPFILSVISLFQKKTKKLLPLLAFITTGIMLVNFLMFSSKGDFLNSLTKDICVEFNPMIELDYKTKEDIYDIRQKEVFKYPNLVNKNYKVSDDVFGKIISNKSWWGIYGNFYYGPGQNSIDGPSEESRFIVNPYLLIGIKEPYAYVMNNIIPKPVAFPPEPSNLIWHKDSTITIEYNLSEYFNKMKEFKYFRSNDKLVSLIAYNARDFGLDYLYIDPIQSENIQIVNKSTQAKKITHYLHLGSSSRYTGGSNNHSPQFPYLDEIRIKKIPAKLYIKLWNKRPRNTNRKARLNYIINIK